MDYLLALPVYLFHLSILILLKFFDEVRLSSTFFRMKLFMEMVLSEQILSEAFQWRSDQ